MLRNDDPRLAIIMGILQSEEGRNAMLLATNKGLPALAGVDDLFVSAPDSDYASDGAVRQEAGWRVKQEMLKMGFKDDGTVSMPSSCIAAEGRPFKQQ